MCAVCCPFQSHPRTKCLLWIHLRFLQVKEAAPKCPLRSEHFVRVCGRTFANKHVNAAGECWKRKGNKCWHTLSNISFPVFSASRCWNGWALHRERASAFWDDNTIYQASGGKSKLSAALSSQGPIINVRFSLLSRMLCSGFRVPVQMVQKFPEKWIFRVNRAH